MKARTFLILVIVVGSSGGAYWLGATSSKSNPAAGPAFLVVDGLGVEEAALDLGEVWVGQEFAPSFTIHNRRPDTAEVLDLQTSCGCTAVEPRSLSIPTGGTASVRIRLNLAPRWQPEVALADRPFFVGVRPVLKDAERFASQGQEDDEGCPFREPAVKKDKPSTPRSWIFRVRVKNPVTLDTLCIHYGDSPVEGGPAVTRKVRARLQVPGTTLLARAEPDLVTVRVTPEPGDLSRYKLVISPRMTLPLGAFSCKVHLDVVRPSGERLPGPALSVWGKVQPAVRALPAQPLLGCGAVGEVIEANVTLLGLREDTWAVDHVETESADVSAQPAKVLDLSAGRTFRIRQRITKEGPQSSAVRFFLRQAGGPPGPVAVRVHYEGLNPRPADAGGERGRKP
jgi:hypothetical protein